MKRRIEIALISAAVVLAIHAGCDRGASTKNPSQSVDNRPAAGTDDTADRGESARTDRGDPVAMWSDPELMDQLEALGLALPARLGVDAWPGSMAQLSEDPVFRPVVEALREDFEEFQREDPELDVGVRGVSHRMFDPDWLEAESTHFELAAVISRIDRRPFTDGACGEVRLLYRLAYDITDGDERIASRLPMTLTVDWLEERRADESCSDVSNRWRPPDDLDDDRRAAWLVAERGPADPDRLAPERIHRVQLNLQSVRWPSAVHPSLGGHAEYVLRSFVPDDEGRLTVEKLENTPDVQVLNEDDQLRAELIDWLRDPEHLKAIDEGTAELPQRFLADRAISVAPRGLARRANRPFARILDDEPLDNLDFEGLDRVQSAEGLVRRLDDKSCAGCHQGRAVAGFHNLGEDPEDAFHANALGSPVSAHAAAELRWREDLLGEISAGASPDYARPFSERDHDRPGGWGTPCGLTDEPTFGDWDCREGLRCQGYDLSADQQDIGICLPDRPQVGDPCEIGTMRSHPDPHRDRIVDVQTRECTRGMVCNSNDVGFPGGMCTPPCHSPGDEGRCGAIAQLEPFNNCLAAENPFEDCLAEHVNPAGLRGCDTDNPCRHDYLCARNEQGQGVCIPPYFLFQMRVDGHPPPDRGTPTARGDDLLWWIRATRD